MMCVVTLLKKRKQQQIISKIIQEIRVSSNRDLDLVQKCTRLAGAIPMLEVKVKVAFTRKPNF